MFKFGLTTIIFCHELPLYTGLEVYHVSLKSRSLLTSNMHLGKMDIFPFSPIMWSPCAYLATCIVCKTILIEYTMVTEDDLSYLEVHHLQSGVKLGSQPLQGKKPREKSSIFNTSKQFKFFLWPQLNLWG